MDSFLQSLAETLKVENASLKEENIGLREKLGMSGGRTPIVFDAVHALRDENASLTEENIALGERLREKDIRLAKLEQRMRAKDARMRKLQDESQAASDLCHKLQVEIRAAQSLAEALTAENEDLREQRAALDEQLHAVRARLGNTTNKKEELADSIQQLRLERTSKSQGDGSPLSNIPVAWPKTAVLPKYSPAGHQGPWTRQKQHLKKEDSFGKESKKVGQKSSSFSRDITSS